MRIIDYLPIEYIFNLLSVFRKGGGANAQAVRIALKRRELRSLLEECNPIDRPGENVRLDAAVRTIPRVSFWLRLCQSASLLDDDLAPYPTLLVEEWLSWPFLRQVSHLLEAWLHVPEREKYRRTRKELIHRLLDGVDLGASHFQELVGLQALGVCEGIRLSTLGMALLKGSGNEQFIGMLPRRWNLENDQLVVPFPPAWRLLWELEFYLNPSAPGVYSLDTSALRLAVQRGALEGRPSILDVLENGLGERPPETLFERLAAEPVIRVIPGPVLEFTHPEELKTLRKFPSLRHELECLLSSRHVALDPWRAQQVLRKLWRQGLISEREFLAIRSPEIRTKRASEGGLAYQLSKTERTYLLSLMLLAEDLQHVAAQPGLRARLTESLDHSLHAAAASKAKTMLEQVRPEPIRKPEDELPVFSLEELIEAIQGIIDRDESIDVLYKASGRHSAEYRHLTPLMIESRAGRFYLIAYCHARRANRTFRLDRLKLIDVPTL